MLKTFLCVCHSLSRFIIMGRILRELLIVDSFLWCIALLCPMDRAFLARRLIVSAGFLIVSVDSLIVSGRGIRGYERGLNLSRKRKVFLLFRGNLYLCSREGPFFWWARTSRTGRTGRRSFGAFLGLGLVGLVGGPLEKFFNN